MDKIDMKEELIVMNGYWEELVKTQIQLINDLLKEKVNYIIRINELENKIKELSK